MTAPPSDLGDADSDEESVGFIMTWIHANTAARG